jgi:hypothetical protein
MKILFAAALAVTMSGAAMAGKGPSYICAYVNDNVDSGGTGLDNATEGYKVGPGDAVVHVGPYSTNGKSFGVGLFAGGRGATRVHPRLTTGDLYVNDGASENITHFTINKTNCRLILDATLYPSGDTSESDGDGLAITPDGRTMFVGSTGDNHIYSHAIAANGSLGTPFTEAATPGNPEGIEVSPDGKTLVVSYDTLRQVCAYPVSGGHLGTPNCQPTVGEPAGVSIDPASTCVYTSEYNALFGPSEVAAFTLTGSDLGTPTDYKPFGPAGSSSSGVLVNWDNMVIYVSNIGSAKITRGSIAPGCKLTYDAVIHDGVSGSDYPGQIAQDKRAHGYVVTGDAGHSMGIFQAHVNGKLTPIGSGQFPLTSLLAMPSTVVVVGSE